MALTSAQRLRLKIQDVPIRVDLTLHGNGTARVFQVEHRNLANASAYVPAAGGASWSATGCTIDASGTFAFSGTISANSAFRVVYDHTTFSDTEIDQFMTDGGGIIGGAVEALQALMFDAVKRARWMASDGSSYDDTSAQSHLRGMYEQIKEEQHSEAIAAGSFGSWSLNQG